MIYTTNEAYSRAAATGKLLAEVLQGPAVIVEAGNGYRVAELAAYQLARRQGRLLGRPVASVNYHGMGDHAPIVDVIPVFYTAG